MLKEPVSSSALRHINKIPLSVAPSLGLNRVPDSKVGRCQASGMCASWGNKKNPLAIFKTEHFFILFPSDFPWCSTCFSPPSPAFLVCTYFHIEWCHRLTPISLFPSLLILPTFQTFFIPGRNRGRGGDSAQELSLPQTTTRGRYSPWPLAACALSQSRLVMVQPQGRGLDPEFYLNQCQCLTFLTDS